MQKRLSGLRFKTRIFVYMSVHVLLHLLNDIM